MINDLVQEITIPPAPPTGLYDADFQSKVTSLLAWYNLHATEATTLIEKLNIFKTEVNGTIPLFSDGLPIADYIGDSTKTFLVDDAALDKEAVNLGVLNSVLDSVLASKIKTAHFYDANASSTLLLNESILGDLSCGLGAVHITFQRVEDVCTITGSLAIEGFSRTFPSDATTSFELDILSIAQALGIFQSITGLSYGIAEMSYTSSTVDTAWFGAKINSRLTDQNIRFNAGETSGNYDGSGTTSAVTDLSVRFAINMIVGD